MKKGVLLVNLGTPDTPTRKDVYRYLQQFLLDERVIDVNPLWRNILVRGIIVPFRSGKSAKLYQKLWTAEGSPLKYYGELLVREVQRIIGDNYVVTLGMRYQSPSIERAIETLLSHNVSSIKVIPLFPQYASATTGSVHEEVMRILSKKQAIPEVKFVNSFHNLPAMIDVFADNARAKNYQSFDHILMSFHGLPERQLLKADRCSHCLKAENCCAVISEKNQFCYSAQCHETARLIADNLGLRSDQYTVCFQSRLGNAQWIQPYTSNVLKARADRGDKRLLVFSPAFVCECLETTIEIGEEYQEEFVAMGGEKVQLVPSLNDDPRWINAIAKMSTSN
ncbi:MAG: ferrochelatase [Saprospiraceae bacterium]|nr:ferrochelatase [Saprospiraceae bacterium]MBP7679834.1 ferrochelatase [Saprospiraceae bacterium]